MKTFLVGTLALVIVSSSVAATSIDWSSNVDGIYAAGVTQPTDASTIYLINTATLTQSLIWEGVYNDGLSLADVIGSSYVGKAAMSEGTFTLQNIHGAEDPSNPGQYLDLYAAGSKQTLFMVCYDENVGKSGALYFSEQITPIAGMNAQTATPYAYQVQSSYDTTILEGMDSFNASQGAWVTNIPEPTSGMLLLLGMMGLALRRKRA